MKGASNPPYVKIIILLSILVTSPAWADTPQTFSDPTVEANTGAISSILSGQIYPALNGVNTAMQEQTQVLQEGMTGVTGVGGTFNSAQEQNFRNWTPTAEDLNNMVQQGLQTGSLADQIKYYNEKFPIPQVTDLTPGHADSVVGNYGVFSAVNTNAALSVADKSFDNAKQIQDQINFLYTLIDRQQTLKQGMDLNSAILVKIAALQADLMRIQSQQLKMQAVSQQQGNSARTVMAGFIQDVK